MFEALRTTTATNTGALFTFGPSFAALFAFFLVGERLSGARLGALVTGLVGAVWVVFRGDPSRLAELDLVSGDALFIAGTAALGLYTVLIKRLRGDEPMAVLTFWTLVTGTGWLLVLGGDALVGVRWSEVEAKVFVAISYLALFTTLITFLLTQIGVTVIGPTRAMAYTYMNPALVALLAWALGEGAIGWRSLPGIGLTLVSLVVILRASPPQEVADDERPQILAGG
jgi:drug/metabolite transporter (DMT)-like permease